MASPLAPTPPSLLPPDDRPASIQLTELFYNHQGVLACRLLQQLSPEEAEVALHAAFQAVQWAPSEFLLALSQWPQGGRRNVFYTLVCVGIDCMNSRHYSFPPPPDLSTLAGELLVGAFYDCRAHTCAAFVTAFNVDIVHLQTLCERLLGQRVKTVITILDVLNMRQLLSLERVVAVAIRQQELDAADTFVRDDTDLQRSYVQMLIDRGVSDKLIKKRMNKFNLPDRIFPEYHARRVRASIRFHVYSKQFDELLSLVHGNVELIEYACHMVVKNLGRDDPITRLFVYRAGQADKEQFAYIDTTGMESQTFPNKDELEPLPSCLSIADLAGADACVFVDTPSALRECVDHLTQAPVVGFDCEWKTATSRDHQTEACAVLQLASATRAFVIDMIALKQHCAPLCDIFRSESIIKLGFDTKGDLSVLTKVLPPDEKTRRSGDVVRNLVDVQTLAKRLRNVEQQHRQVSPSARGGEEVEDGEIVETSDMTDDGVGSSTEQPKETAGTALMDEKTTDIDVKRTQSTADEEPEPTNALKKQKQEGDSRGKKFSLSLAAVAEHYLGKPLDKRSRMSDWERRPLTRAQLHYAAMDALVLVAIFNAMRQCFTETSFSQMLAQLSRTRATGGTNDPGSLGREAQTE